MKKIIMMLVVTFAMGAIICGCSSKTSSSKADTTTTEASTEEANASTEDARNGDDIKSDVSGANAADAGKTDTISGSYKIKIADQDIKNTFYVFKDSKMMILENGSYDISDGTVSVVTTNSCKVTDSTVAIAGDTYDWRANAGAIELLTNKTLVMTLIPNK